MVPALHDGDRVLCEVLRDALALRRGALVLIRWRPPLDAPIRPVGGAADRYDIKRLVALAGDRAESFGCGAGIVPAGHCLVLSDNLDQGQDSRRYGPVPLGMVVARVLGSR